jgi:hypothetical protein
MFGLPFGEKILLQSRDGIFICFGEALDDVGGHMSQQKSHQLHASGPPVLDAGKRCTL